ncbi:prolyl oligopeptidase family-domain-containing protein [Globomyces pollinis-pini]|nr:prolyl oligopeptidase family-domain-containing protein [Globomyces pollinis-pini]
MKNILSKSGKLKGLFGTYNDPLPVPLKIPSEKVLNYGNHKRIRCDDFDYFNIMNANGIHMNDIDRVNNKLKHKVENYLRQELKYMETFQNRHSILIRAIKKEIKASLPSIPLEEPKYVRNTKTYFQEHMDTKVLKKILKDDDPQYPISKTLVSNDHSKIAYLKVEAGHEQGTLFIKDLVLEETMNISISKVFNFVWSPDNNAIFYTRLNHILHSSTVYKSSLSSKNAKEKIIYEELDPQFFVDVSVSKNKQLILITSSSKDSSEVHYIADSKLNLLSPRRHGVRYFADGNKDNFYILHNDTDTKQQVLSKICTTQLPIDLSKSAIIFKPEPKVAVMDVEIFQDSICFYLSNSGKPEIYIHAISKNNGYYVKLPDTVCLISPGVNPDFATDTIQFSYSSPFIIQAHCQINIHNGQITEYSSKASNIDRKQFTSKLIHVTSWDGQKIPVTLIYKSDIEFNGQNPCLVSAYGAYGLPLTTHFRVHHIPLLKRNFVIALAHVRGGNELGNEWHENGRLANKENCFKDLESVCDFLIQSRMVSPDKIVGEGTSAGALIFGVVKNRKPDLFKALVLRVPYLDVVTGMMDPNHPLTVSEYGEWGDPSTDVRVFDRMVAYSPYDQLVSSKTSVLLSGGVKDERVPFWHPLKYLAKLRTIQSENEGVLHLLHSRDGGHFASFEEELAEKSVELAFIISLVK